MNRFEKFSQALGFTHTEARVVIFLVASFVVGLGIKLAKNTMQKPARFDYTAADSEFAARSSRSNADTAMAEPLPAAIKAGEKPQADNGSRPLVDINIAGKSDLIPLPGIGDVMAERIIQYRDEHGKFGSVNDLKNVKGIGVKKLERIRPFCTIGKH